MSIYKNFKPSDISSTPFNAHKQYSFDSGSAVNNGISYYLSRWTSASRDDYSHPFSGSGDTFNALKYFQIDHLFYKNFKTNINNRLGETHYLKQKRHELYDRTNILSISTGLYGHQIKPGSFYLSGSGHKIIDDTYGNLIISGTIVDNYPTDIRSNLFSLGPIKGFKNYDLSTHNEIGSIGYGFSTNYLYGKKRVNVPHSHSTPTDTNENDESYYFNSVAYNNIKFVTSSIGNNNLKENALPTFRFDSKLSPSIKSAHNEKFNFNPEDDFSISFRVEPQELTPEVGSRFGGGIVFYIFSGSVQGASNRDDDYGPYWDGRYALIATEKTALSSAHRTNGSSLHFNNDNQGIGSGTGLIDYGAIGVGLTCSQDIVNNSSVGPGSAAKKIQNFSRNGYSDWYMPNTKEITEMLTVTQQHKNIGTDIIESFNETGTHTHIWSSNFYSYSWPFGSPPVIGARSMTHTFSLNGDNLPPFADTIPAAPNSNYQHPNSHQNYVQNSEVLPIIAARKHFLDPRKDPDTKRYIISKSSRKTVVPEALSGQSGAPVTTFTSGALQPLETQAEPQFPFEIYMLSQSIHFNRYDGEILSSAQCYSLTSSLYTTGSAPIHVVCQKTGSSMEIYLDGKLKTSIIDETIKQTQNRANIYIGSKGQLGKGDEYENKSEQYYNGLLDNINIWSEAFNATTIANMSESINNTPYIGNIFYSNGLATISHPKHQGILKPTEYQYSGYYPLSNKFTASNHATNQDGGTFVDASIYNNSSSGYFKLYASHSTTVGNDAVGPEEFPLESASFEVISHNKFHGNCISFSGSLSGSGKRGREFIRIPNQKLPSVGQTGKFSLAWLMKEAPGYEDTGSNFMGSDLDLNEDMPFDYYYAPYLGIDASNRLRFRDRAKTFWGGSGQINVLPLPRSASHHCVITYDGSNPFNSTMTFYANGKLLGQETLDISNHQHSGSFGIEAIGSGYYQTGLSVGGFSGSIGQVQFFDGQILSSQSINQLNNNPETGIYGEPINNLKFQGSHLMYENEYQCTVEEHEYLYSNNISARKIKSDQEPELAAFATSSFFRPYVTTIGLYNDKKELLALGKLGQPIRMSDETDTTFVIRWDT